MKGSFIQRIAQYAKQYRNYMERNKLVPVSVNSYSQEHVLRHKMQQAGMSHDQKALVDLTSVRIEKMTDIPVLFFCPQEDVVIKTRLQEGDGEDLPFDVQLEGIKVPKGMKSGTYDLKNVMLHSNGTISITATPETDWVKSDIRIPS